MVTSFNQHNRSPMFSVRQHAQSFIKLSLHQTNRPYVPRKAGCSVLSLHKAGCSVLLVTPRLHQNNMSFVFSVRQDAQSFIKFRVDMNTYSHPYNSSHNHLPRKAGCSVLRQARLHQSDRTSMCLLIFHYISLSICIRTSQQHKSSKTKTNYARLYVEKDKCDA